MKRAAEAKKRREANAARLVAGEVQPKQYLSKNDEVRAEQSREQNKKGGSVRKQRSDGEVCWIMKQMRKSEQDVDPTITHGKGPFLFLLDSTLSLSHTHATRT